MIPVLLAGALLVLKQAGYATGTFGKWGLGDAGTDGVPTKQGFDHGALELWNPGTLERCMDSNCRSAR